MEPCCSPEARAKDQAVLRGQATESGPVIHVGGVLQVMLFAVRFLKYEGQQRGALQFTLRAPPRLRCRAWYRQVGFMCRGSLLGLQVCR